jgi:DNA-binding transcriptional MerR regulator
MKTGDIAQALGVSDDTIRNWIKTFGEFISTKRGIQHTITDEDFEVLAAIAILRSDNVDTETIRQKLKDGYRVEKPSFTAAGLDLSVVPRAAVEQMVDLEKLRVQYEKTRTELETVLNLLAKRDEKIEELQDEVKKLQRELGRMEGRLEEIEKRPK